MPERAPRYAGVIVDIAHADVDHVFTYRIPQRMQVTRGTRVGIPFGHRTTEGLVVGITDEPGIELGKIKDLIGPLEEYPAVLPQLMDLAEEMRAQAHCPLAATLRLMLPAQMRGGRVKVKTEKFAQLTVQGEALETARKAQSRSPKRKLLLDLLADGQARPVSELAVLVRTPLDGLRVLEEQGAVRVFDREVLRSPYPEDGAREEDPQLTPPQQEVLEELLPAVRAGKGKFLLYGVTGSGKTEVYIRAVRECLKLGKGAIVLVPEIVLTTQMVT
ncbi:MAG: DEAD/DEAH box helicase family protein [Clostridiales bacterium]|nr:DEAD/DEAH box helicase family protein [Clostridiales bacterium]